LTPTTSKRSGDNNAVRKARPPMSPGPQMMIRYGRDTSASGNAKKDEQNLFVRLAYHSAASAMACSWGGNSEDRDSKSVDSKKGKHRFPFSITPKTPMYDQSPQSLSPLVSTQKNRK
jgi:hypothetical protein